MGVDYEMQHNGDKAYDDFASRPFGDQDLDGDNVRKDVSSVQTGTDADAADMAQLGRSQELRRNFKTLSVLGLSVTTMSTWVALLLTNTFALIKNENAQENKAQDYILQVNKRAQRNPSQAKQAAQESRTLARELIRLRRHEQRVVTSKATLESVRMQVNEAFAMKKIAGSTKRSVGIMKDVNMLVKLPEISGAMRELSQELVSAGVLEEMVGDSLLDNETLEGEDEEAESEIDMVLGEILNDKVQALGAQVPTEMVAPEVPQLDEEEEIRSEAVLAQMRRRLELLKD
ncbi:Vacuolar protein-sorting-associated protein 24 [Elasticomyces elasticus]|nr:Vacuolar protein-sorting-associated protein 24 [Elasticomyces elasticus]